MAKATPKSKRNKGSWKVGHSGNPAGRATTHQEFSNTLRELISKRKMFRRPDGTVFESSELELIAKKVIKALRTNKGIDVKLLEVALNRLEGKAKETVELDATLEMVKNGINAREVLLSRLGRILRPKSGKKASEESES